MKTTGDFSFFEKAIKELEKLNHYQVAVGFFGERGDKLLTIVGANEYGAHIVPKNGEWLTIPTENVPDGGDGLPQRARDIPGLFRPKGKNILAVNEGGKLVVYYYLVKSVDIPSRPFIRTAFRENKAKYQRMMENGVKLILEGKKTTKELLEAVGMECQADIQESIRNWSKPPNAPATIARKKNTNNPLIDTGVMRQKVTYRIVPT